MALRWRKEKQEGGMFGRIRTGPLGRELTLDGVMVGRVAPVRVGQPSGHMWYWYSTHIRVPTRNTSDRPVKDLDAAMRDCETYIREHLGLPKRKTA